MIPKSSLSISESDLREVSVAVFGAFHHYLGVGVGEPEALPSSYSGRASHPGCPLVHGLMTTNPPGRWSRRGPPHLTGPMLFRLSPVDIGWSAASADVHSAIHEETKVLDSHRVVLVQKAG